MSTRSDSTSLAWSSPLAFVGSLCTHALLAWLIMTNMNSCGRQGNFGTGEGVREIGLYMVDDPTATGDGTSPTPAEVASLQDSQPTQVSPALPDLPANLNETLTQIPGQTDMAKLANPSPLIGPGAASGGAATPGGMSGLPSFAPIAGGGPSPFSGAGIPSTTRFFNIDTRGQRLLYVIDCSGSMSKHNAFRYAKSELVASLERLNSNHKFQLIFYNDKQFEFDSRTGERDVHWATAANLTRARSYISQLDNSGGTAHYPALMKALAYAPDVIFFLTDAAEPALSAKQLDDVVQKNQGKAAIHCIEFGLGPDPQLENFLKKLSRQNSGTYSYRDMSKLGL